MSLDISIIITSYNYARYLCRAITSAINQSYPSDKFEIIVVDDASSDETRDVMDSFSGRIIPVHLQNNVGLSESRNIGIRASSGRYVIHLDADDYFDEHILAEEYSFLEKNGNFSAVSCDYSLIDRHGYSIEVKNGSLCPIACGIMYVKESLFDIGLYNPLFRAMEEQELRSRFESRYSVGHIPLALYRYRRHDKNLTNNKAIMNHYASLLDSGTELCACQN